MQETHRYGSLKQQNKAHKHGRHRSKGTISGLSKGKVSAKSVPSKFKGQLSKNDRRYQVQQLRAKKREDALMKKRKIGGSVTPPFLVAVVPLSFETVPEKLINSVIGADEDGVVTCSKEHVFHLSVPRWKQRFSFTTPPRHDLYATLDSLKVVDTVIFLLSAKTTKFVDCASEKLLTCLMSQGLPTSAVALIDLEDVPAKKRVACKQEAQKIIDKWLPNEKIVTLEKNGDALTLLRKLGSQKQRTLVHRDNRPHMLAEEVQFIPQDGNDFGVLKVSGYLKGTNLSVNGLIHIPGWGDFQMHQIDAPPDPHPFEKKYSMDEDVEILQVAQPEHQTSLVSENAPDPLDAEQTWPTKEELEDASKARKIKRIPKGMSEYHACWIPDEEGDDVDDDEDKEDEDGDDMVVDPDSEDSEQEWEECEVATVGEESADRYDESIDVGEEEEAKLKAAREEVSFPDEVDTPQDVPARERFAKYRGLASFRTSPWDPKENLPLDYARIFQFEHFERSRKRILKEIKQQLDGVPAGGYVTVYVKNVPCDRWTSRPEGQPLILFGLLPHEHQLSVMNFVVKRAHQSIFSQKAIKSKDPVVIHCGFRRYKARPIYSQHTNGSKHKYERFFQPEATVVATVYAPIMFPPASVLVFTESGGGLIATGRVLSANPDRLIIKRAILSGHPFRVMKHSAIIRFMFFNREDIEWFKPVELRTKYGRRGHIKEPLGTRGHMKAVFDDQLKSQDTVLMTLYKRMFPPWSYDPVVQTEQPLYTILPTIREEEEKRE